MLNLQAFYDDVEFTIDDREDRTPILLDRTFMKRLNVLSKSTKKVCDNN